MKSANAGKFYNQAATTRFFSDLADAMTEFKTDAWYQELAADDIIDADDFQGQTAEADKKFLKDVQKSLLNDVLTLQDDLITLQDSIQQKFADEVDSAPDANIEYDVIEEIKQDFRDLHTEFTLNCLGVQKLASRCVKYNKYYPFTGVDFSKSHEAFHNFCGGILHKGYLDECQEKLVTFDEEVCQMIEDAGLTARIAELEDYFDRARLMAHPKEVAKETLDNLIDTARNNLQEVAYLFVEEIKENTEKKAAKEKEDEKIELEDIDSVGMAVSFAAQSIHDGQQYLDDKKEEYGEAYSAKVEECKTAAQDMWSDGVKGLQSDLKKKGYDIPELDGLVDAGNMALEKVSVAVDLPSREVNLDKLEADIGKALKKLVDLKPDEYYNLTYEKLPVTAKTLLVTAELGTEIVTGEFTSYNQLKANTKENFKNLAKGGEYCITDMIAGAIKLPNMGAQLISSKHTKHMNQLQDIADCKGSLENYADIKLDKIENAINSIESAAVTAGADFINSSKEEKYKTLGYAGTTIAMFADAAFSLADGIKAARAAAKAAKAAEALAEGGECVSNVYAGCKYSTFGEMSEVEGIRYRDWNYEKIKEISIHNPNSDTLTLGKYRPTIEIDRTENWKIAGNDSYNVIAENNGDMYFDMKNGLYDSILKNYNLSYRDMFDEFNTSALDKAIIDGKVVRFTHNPELVEYAGSFINQEWKYLQQHGNYLYLREEGGFWYAEK